ncbi:Uncharacterized protein dnm_007210 [Desulfonema magnum]|uniref:Uncharacterized protein n=1 Tax=Desulfonema magnum TaxID=45655 RepID=A0A975BFY9_9BACT|nr:Uncharacterized protein dnm_007210 [Desulfonema magnum]
MIAFVFINVRKEALRTFFHKFFSLIILNLLKSLCLHFKKFMAG